MAVGREVEQRVDRRQPGVAGSGAVAALPLEVVEEIGHSLRVDVCNRELGGLFAEPRLGAAEQQPGAVAVGGDRMWAGVALADEPGR